MHDERCERTKNEDCKHGLPHHGLCLIRLSCADIAAYRDAEPQRNSGKNTAHEPCERRGQSDGCGGVLAERANHCRVHILDNHDQELFEHGWPSQPPDDARWMHAFVKHIDGTPQTHFESILSEMFLQFTTFRISLKAGFKSTPPHVPNRPGRSAAES